uniref:Outer membrane protein assembly factor BamB n=1 Tax=Candidatus Kentrum sp. FM TaxID=2126340 RepID=A0A450SGQ3_9GAMM|nr:MAG: outer membrane protein assembly factor BamB [Candidatus Kentron sp. FM]VFJ52208.1 MAG: outer membrane protein assembly factor BamB [Candidatus Kentron sp. FM]VFK09339.1 MAG: outer membrane protein assembly factor BamB [Candidatus Kentron sp. FM]
MRCIEKTWLLATVFAGILVSLAGCGGAMWESGNEATKPAPLTKFEPRIQVQKIWKRDVGAGTKGLHVKLTPVVHGKRLFAATPKGEVHAYDAQTGKFLWETDIDIPIRGGPGVGAETVLVGSNNGEVVALSQENGAILWKAKTSSEILTVPREKSGVVIVRTVDGKLFGLEAVSGARRWIYERQVPVLTLRGTSAPVIAGNLVIAGFDGGQLAALSVENGRTAWERRIALPSGRSDIERMVDIDGEIVVVGNAVYVVTFQGQLAAVDVASGEIFWRRDMSSHAGLGVYKETLYVTDEKAHVWALDRYTGETLWHQKELEHRHLSAPAGFNPAGGGEYAVVGDFKGYAHFLDKKDGRIVARIRVDKKGILAPPTVAGDILYVYGGSGMLTAIEVAK